MTKNEMLKTAFYKKAFLGDAVRGIFGYHNLNEISQKTGIPKKDVATYYHSLHAPNKMLYSADNVAKDISNIYNKREKYNRVREESGLFDTQPRSKEEADVMKRYGKQMDDSFKSVLQTQNDLIKKYKRIKDK